MSETMPPAVVADAVTAIREQLRMGETGEEAVLARVAGTALHLAEAYLATTLIARGCEDVIAPTGGWQRLAAMPVTQIAGVMAVPVDAAPTLVPADRHAIDIDADGHGWVRIVPTVGTRVAVSYQAGSAARWDALPVPVAQGIAMLAAHLFEHREGGAMPPAAVAALWRPFRRLRLAEAAR